MDDGTQKPELGYIKVDRIEYNIWTLNTGYYTTVYREKGSIKTSWLVREIEGYVMDER